MTTSQQPGSTADRSATPETTAAVGPRAGLSELVVPGILIAIAIFLIIGTVNMKLPPSVQVPGPTFFPMIVIGLLLLMALLSTIQILRGHARALREHRNPVRRADHGEGSGYDDEKDLVGDDVGVDGAGASAEEAAVHVIDEAYEQDSDVE